MARSKFLTPWRNARLVLALVGLGSLGACASGPRLIPMTAHECMTRVMYFESNRTSEEGMIAVGTVVMNRVDSPKFPDTVCGVVGQKNQFAPGVLTRKMEAGRQLASASATKVLDDRLRHRKVGNALFFHTAGMTFPYTNMHYLVVAGGNVFYEKRKNARRLNDPPFRNPGARTVRVEQSTVNTGTSEPVRVPVAVRSVAASPRPAAAPTSLQTMSIDELIDANRY